MQTFVVFTDIYNLTLDYLVAPFRLNKNIYDKIYWFQMILFQIGVLCSGRIWVMSYVLILDNTESDFESLERFT